MSVLCWFPIWAIELSFFFFFYQILLKHNIVQHQIKNKPELKLPPYVMFGGEEGDSITHLVYSSQSIRDISQLPHTTSCKRSSYVPVRSSSKCHSFIHNRERILSLIRVVISRAHRMPMLTTYRPFIWNLTYDMPSRNYFQ